jgi:hypothetical protein
MQFTKKKVLIISLAGIFLMLFVGYLESLDGCYNYFFSLCEYFGDGARVLMIFIMVF